MMMKDQSNNTDIEASSVTEIIEKEIFFVDTFVFLNYLAINE